MHACKLKEKMKWWSCTLSSNRTLGISISSVSTACSPFPSLATDKHCERSLLIALLAAALCFQRRRCHSRSTQRWPAMKFGENISKSALAAVTKCTLLFIHVRCWPAHSVGILIARLVDPHTLELHAVPIFVRAALGWEAYCLLTRTKNFSQCGLK